jgi:hypothetical protein
MILYHYADPNRPIVNGGYWFDHGGKLRDNVPDFLAPMVFVPDWDPDYICCCDNIADLLLYFPQAIHEKLNGLYGVYEYTGKLIVQRDNVMQYITADANKLKLLDQLDYSAAKRLGELALS